MIAKRRNEEARMTKEARMLKWQICDSKRALRHSDFVIPSCFDIRHSSFKAHEHRLCWSRSHGREHGAPFKRSAVPDYGGLRHKPRESDICCRRGGLRSEPGFIGSYSSI